MIYRPATPRSGGIGAVGKIDYSSWGLSVAESSLIPDKICKHQSRRKTRFLVPVPAPKARGDFYEDCDDQNS
jgi:hypothetical protein